ncbi:hypothetical protein [Streptomyces sp. H39-C1]|uniref:hypothetical protein n=1 Tax=Streptomyces sp. H39-C1 TaxID=3004355 RepID=UPI0022AFC4B7|nr:hypothetical protein [Streptomyces sp. H39-C1]MCZ4101085.1 hypothetical protein [Streptomyces sp. H39-C1]
MVEHDLVVLHRPHPPVLIRSDQPTPADQPLLSALLAGDDPELVPRYRSVAAALGRNTPSNDTELRDVITSEVHRVHEVWRHQ